MITFRQFLIVLFGTAFGSAQFALPSFQAVSSKDNNKPIITITATDGSNTVANNSITNDATLTVTFTANESVTGFAIGDIGTFGGSVSSFSGSGSSYTATFTPSSARNTGIYLVKDVYTDASSNNNLASLPFYWKYDASAPTIIAGTTVASNNTTVTVKLSEQVYDTNSGTGALEVGDFAFSISGGAATLASSTPTSISKANPSFTARTIGTPNGPVEITYYDLDLDNDIDIIVPLNPGGKLIWYENNGSQSFTENTIDASVGGPREAWPVDLDLDGDIDIVQAVEGADDDLVWYENNGSQNFTKNTIDGSPGGSARSVSVGDIDGDGDLDISLTTYSSSNFYWYENNGSQSFTRRTISTDNTLFPVLIDLDEDGDFDFVSHINDGSNKIAWYENDGSENFTQNIIANDYGAQLAVADLDEDGDYDVIGADYTNGHINWYENNGSESFTKNTIDNSDMTNAWDIKVGDVDGDGDLDVVGMASTNNSTADDKIVLYRNNGSEAFTEFVVDDDLNRPYKFRMTDIDNDGDLDMMVGSRDEDKVIWYENVDGGYILGLSLSGTPSGAETVTVSPASSAIFDVAGNAASTSQSNNTGTLNDQLGPTMTITAVDGSSNAVSDGSTTNDATLTVTFTSSESTSNFVVGDVTVSGGSLSSFSGSGTTYTATFTPSSNGATTIDVAGEKFTDASGNDNSAATQFNWTYDSVVPTISGSSLASDNSTVAVTMSEAVYNSSNGSGSLEVSDFVFSITGGSATLASSTPSSISVSGNVYTLGISLSGSASGAEQLTITPASSAIYDVAGNVASTSQSNNTVTLNDVTGPTMTITASNGMVLIFDGSTTSNSTISITFTSSESTSNFVVGDVTVSGGSLSSFSGSGTTYTATFTPSSNGATTIDVAGGTFTDAAGNNNSAATQFNWTYDSTVPTITGSSLASDNSTVAVTFSEAVYNSSSGSGSLEVSDFVYSLVGGTATLSGTTPSSISASGNVYTLGISLSGTANGAEQLTITPASTAIYDIAGNVASTSQSNNTVTLNDVTGPTMTITAADGSGNVVTDGSTTNDANLTMTFTTSDITSNFVVGDITVSGGSLSSFTQSSNVQMGSSIEGSTGDEFLGRGASISSDGNRIAVGAPKSDDNGSESGSVDMYEWSGSAWTQMGNSIVGSAAGDWFGEAVALDQDGDRVVIGAPNNDTQGSDAGEVKVYSWNGSAWSQLGSTIYGPSAEASAAVGTSVDINDAGDKIVFGAYGYDGGSTNKGIAWVYSWNGSAWVIQDNSNSDLIGGSSRDSYGWRVSFDSDGDRLAISGYGGSNINGVVGMYEWDGSSWNIMGSTLTGSTSQDFLGSGISLDADGDQVAVGIRGEDGSAGNSSGAVSIYSWGGSSWGLVGSTVEGSVASKGFGGSVSISSSGEMFVAGASSSGVGYAKVYKWNGSAWAQEGSTIDGLSSGDTYGWITSLSSDGKRYLVSAQTNDNSGVDAGRVQVYSTGSSLVYTATFTPSSDGATTIDVSGGAYTDGDGNNNTAATQFNWTYDSTVPNITGNSLASDNSTIAVTFSEAVYNSAAGSGALAANDFALSISGGTATLSSSTPSSISVSSNTYTLGISLSGSPNGSETITVNPVTNSIYDIAGNVASTSQSNNTASLNAVNYVLNLNGTDEYANRAHSTDFEPLDWSLQAWIDPTSLPSAGNSMWVVSKHQVYRIGLTNTGGTTKIHGEMRKPGTSSWEKLQGTTLADASGGWYHVVLTRDDSANDLILYVNGVNVAENLGFTISTNNNNSEFMIGNRNGGSSAWYDGRVDEVAFWDTELSANAVSALYNSGAGLSASSNSGNYTFSGDLLIYLKMQQNLQDSANSYDFSNQNLNDPDDYDQTNF